VVERPTRHKEEERRGADQNDDREPRQQGTPSYDTTNEGEKCGQGKAHDEKVPQREGRDARDGRLKGEESLGERAIATRQRLAKTFKEEHEQRTGGQKHP